MYIPPQALPGNQKEQTKVENILYVHSAFTNKVPFILSATKQDGILCNLTFEEDAETIYRFLIDVIPSGTFEKLSDKIHDWNKRKSMA